LLLLHTVCAAAMCSAGSGRMSLCGVCRTANADHALFFAAVGAAPCGMCRSYVCCRQRQDDSLRVFAKLESPMLTMPYILLLLLLLHGVCAAATCSAGSARMSRCSTWRTGVANANFV
jgi:hypothetical protein